MTVSQALLWMKFFFYVDEKCWSNKFQCCCPDKSQKWPFSLSSTLFCSEATKTMVCFIHCFFLFFNFSFYDHLKRDFILVSDDDLFFEFRRITKRINKIIQKRYRFPYYDCSAAVTATRNRTTKTLLFWNWTRFIKKEGPSNVVITTSS